MAEYLRSAETRRRLIEAAGQLFAEKGIDAVTTREIAAKAGTMQNAIGYHFGGIDGLIMAVWGFVEQIWKPESFAEFLRNTPIPTRKKEKAALISEVVHRLFAIVYTESRPLWISRFLVQCAMFPEGRRHIAATVSGHVVPLLRELYINLTGCSDSDTASCWSLRLLAAPVVFTAGLTAFARFEINGKINTGLYQKLEAMTLHETLLALGLEDEK